MYVVQYVSVVLVVDDEGKGQEKVCADVPRAAKGGLGRLDRGTEAETTMGGPHQAQGRQEDLQKG